MLVPPPCAADDDEVASPEAPSAKRSTRSRGLPADDRPAATRSQQGVQVERNVVATTDEVNRLNESLPSGWQYVAEDKLQHTRSK